MNWRPIETAPRDGTKILLYMKIGLMYVGSYSKGQIYFHIDPENYHWRSVCCDRYGGPTHWMPLPSPPTGEEV